MKRPLFVLLVLCGFLLIANPSWALLLTDGITDVGSEDTIWRAADLGDAGDSTVIAWINSVTPEDYTIVDYFKPTGIPTFYNVQGDTSLRAFELQNEPDYFIIKFGDANGTYIEHVLYSNLSKKDWAVFDLDGTYEGKAILNIGAFSHYAEIGGTPVPEPSTIFLLGLGLVGLAGIGRKKIKS